MCVEASVKMLGTSGDAFAHRRRVHKISSEILSGRGACLGSFERGIRTNFLIFGLDCRATHPLSNEPNHSSLRENVTEELAFKVTP